MKVIITTRFGDKIEFERKEKKTTQLPGETFLDSLVRCWYPKEWRKIQKQKKGKVIL